MNDLERFKFFKLDTLMRIMLAAAFYALGATVQVLSSDHIFPGVLAIILGWFPLALKRITNKPKDQGKEEWRPVSMVEVDRLVDTMRASKKVRKTLVPALGGKIAFVVFAVLVSVFMLAMSGDLGLAAVDMLLFLVPSLFLGGVSVFVPAELDMKIASFAPILTDSARPEGLSIVPYLRFDEDEKGKDVPEDIRLMAELKRAPADFVGIQFQVAINNGPNGAVPYMYAVMITRGLDGPSRSKVKNLSVAGFEVEPGGEEAYGTVVVRQSTESGGYHTTKGDVERLYQIMLKVADEVRKTA